MHIEKRLELVKLPPTEEIITEEELRQLLETKKHPNHYIGFEISGKMHLGTLFVAGIKVRDFLNAGFNCMIFLADWHTYINKKLGGDWEKIKLGAKYFEEAFKFFLGRHKRLKFVLGSELYHNNDEYWMNVVRIASVTSLRRMMRALTIMGRKETESLSTAQLIYPPMQAADILALNVDVAHAGTDQRKVHMLLRDIALKIGLKRKPVAIHHHLLPGLAEPVTEGYDENPELDKKISSKMSKSKPWTCIFIHDSDEEIKSKLKKAWCPEGVVEDNPVLAIAKFIIFREIDKFKIERPIKYGGDIVVKSYEELEKIYKNRELHPMDLKINVARELSKIN